MLALLPCCHIVYSLSLNGLCRLQSSWIHQPTWLSRMNPTLTCGSIGTRRLQIVLRVRFASGLTTRSGRYAINLILPLYYIFCFPFAAHLPTQHNLIIPRCLKSLLRSRIIASTYPPAVLDMSCKCGAKWGTIVETLISGVTGVILWSGDPTTAQVKLQNVCCEKGHIQ